MNRNLYIFGIFIIGLLILSGLLHSIIYLLMDYQMVFFPSFLNWFALFALLHLAVFTILLMYFYYKKYWLAFSTGLLVALATTGQSILMFNMYVSGGVMGNLGLPVSSFALSAGILYSVSLIFSKTGERLWLKTAGVFILVMSIINISLIVGLVNSHDVQTHSMLHNIGTWMSLVYALIFCFYILNFWSELKILKEENFSSSMQKSLAIILTSIALVALVSMLYLGYNVANESYWSLDREKKAPEISKKLAEPFDLRIFVNSEGDTLQYLLMKPQDYDSLKRYPLVVCLHGGTWALPPDKARHLQVVEPALILSNTENREKYPAFLFIPQCPTGYSWGGTPNFPSVDSRVFETIRALKEEFEIDEKRLYVAGGSGGGMGSWHFIGTRPDMFAAAIPFCGAGNPELAHAMVNIPVWAFHGSKDRNVPAHGSREMIEAIRNAGGNPLYTEFPGVGHDVWPHIQDTPGVLDWLFAQRRE